jgi:hypothetical protein
MKVSTHVPLLASSTDTSAAVPVGEMLTKVQKAKYVLWLHGGKSVAALH